MGNQCTEVRDSASEKWTATKSAVGNGMSATGNAFNSAGAYTRDSFECSKMRVQGFKVQQIDDTSAMAPVTQF